MTASRESLSPADSDEVAGRDGTTPARRPGTAARLRRIAWWSGGFLVAFWASLLLSRTNPTNSDGASQALQGWDILHGNILLHGWFTSDIPVYTTEVPEYALVVLLRGLNADDVHVAAALTYALAMLLATLLAIGRARGREAAVRGAIAAGIMIAPQLDAGTYTLLNSPDHMGTTVPILATWLIADRGPRRWWTPVLVGLAIAWAGFGDLTILFVAAVPLLLTCSFRVLRGWLRWHEPLAAQWPDLALIAAGVAGGAVTEAAPHILGAIGGPGVAIAGTQLSPLHVIFWHNIRVAGLSWLMIFGAYFIGVHNAVRAGLAFLHLAGVALGAGALLLGLWRYPREKDLTAQLLVASIACNLVAFVAGGHAVELSFGREMSPVLGLCAALAGRLLGPRLLAPRLAARVLRPALAVALAGYLAGLGYNDTRPAVPPQNSPLAAWLTAHHLRYGLSGYWAANVISLTTREQVQVRSVDSIRGRSDKLRPSSQQVEPSWYDPARHVANFVALYSGPVGTPPFGEFNGVPSFSNFQRVYATFGRPARTYHFGRYTVLVYDKNLLADLPRWTLSATS